MTTKERISEEARRLFSIKGYEATSVRDIAKAVGIKDSSLYNHYKNKQEIFDYIIECYEEVANREFMEFYNNNNYADENIIIESSIAILMAFIDPCVVETRRMLAMEMYHNENAKNIYYKLFYKEPYNWCEIIFGELIKSGIIREENIETLYYRFYSPIFMLILECDFKSYREEELINKIRKHGVEFLKEYRSKGVELRC